jgi:hypothetical protein
MNAFASVICVVSFRDCARGIRLGIGVAEPFSAVGAFFGAIERIHHKHRIARFGEPFAHLAECGPQSEDVRPNQDAWGRAGCRMHEVAVRGAVRRHHGYFGFGHSDRVWNLGQHHGHAGAQHFAELPSCYD